MSEGQQIPRSWQRRVIEKIGAAEGPGFSVYELKPDRSKDNEVYQLSGTEEGVAQQISLFLALREYFESKNTNFDWKKFEEEFEKGFILASFMPNTTPTIQPWGNFYSERPKFKELWGNIDAQAKGYFGYDFWPNRENESDRYKLVGSSLAEIANQAIQIMHQQELLKNVQRVIGAPVTEYLRHAPRANVSLTIYLSTFKDPPFNFRRRGYLQKSVTIPYPRRDALTYANLRAVCGSSAGLGWGIHRAVAWVADDIERFPKGKGAPQMWASGSSKAEAIKNLKSFMTLLEPGVKILRTNYSETELEEGTIAQDATRGNLRNYKVYPERLTVNNARLVSLASQQQGLRTLAGKLNTKHNDLPLWQERQPSGWGQHLADFLRWDATPPQSN